MFGRPSLYQGEETCKLAMEYIDSCVDEEVQVVVGESDQRTTYENKVKVHLPTIEGLAKYLDVTRPTIYNWAKENPDFSAIVELILIEQKQRLIEEGLSGTYNPTIAKLVLSSNHGMRDRVDQTTDDESLNRFTDEQVDRIADRISRRKRGDDNSPVTE